MERDLTVTDLWYYMNSRAIFRKGIDYLHFLAGTFHLPCSTDVLDLANASHAQRSSGCSGVSETMDVPAVNENAGSLLNSQLLSHLCCRHALESTLN